eukprot:1354174-Amorphochlora_amoeboformis.AAC.2
MVIKREKQKLCNFIEWKDKLIVFKRYASLFFVGVVERKDNELLMLEVIHHYVETLDGYFGNVCELDIIFNFHKAYFILDELVIAGQLQETSKRKIIQACHAQDLQMEEGKDGKKDDKTVYLYISGSPQDMEGGATQTDVIPGGRISVTMGAVLRKLNLHYGH